MPVRDEAAGEATQVYAGPAVRKLAREFGVQLARIDGTGPQGRVLKEDLQQFVQKLLREPAGAAASGAGLPVVPEIDFAKFGTIEIKERSKLDKLTAANMQRSWLNVPHVTQFDEADITDLEEFRTSLKAEAERRAVRLTPVPFLLKACAVALRDNPKLSTSLARNGEDLVYKKYIHIGMAVDTPAGLVVPVIRDVDRKTVWELAAEVAELAAKARERKLVPGEMQGGCSPFQVWETSAAVASHRSSTLLKSGYSECRKQRSNRCGTVVSSRPARCYRWRCPTIIAW